VYHVIITEPAKSDVRNTAAYIATKLHNKIAASRLMNDAYKAMYSLDEMPRRHPLVDDEYLAGCGMRFFPVRNYLVFYIIHEKNKTVEIERFLYSARNWAAILKGEELEDDNFYPTL